MCEHTDLDSKCIVHKRGMAFTIVDVETAGPDVEKDQIIAVGLVTMDGYGHIRDSCVLSLPLLTSPHEFSHLATRDFWMQPDNLDVLKNGYSIYQVKDESQLAHSVRTYLDKQWTTYETNHCILSNHSVYDLGFLNAALSRHNLANTSYDHQGKFYKSVDVDSFVRGFMFAKTQSCGSKETLDPMSQDEHSNGSILLQRGFKILQFPMNELYRQLHVKNPYLRNHFPVSDAAYTGKAFISIFQCVD